MSGAPIIQNNKFIGAVTHVLVNDPTTGYAVFGDIMLKQSKEEARIYIQILRNKQLSLCR